MAEAIKELNGWWWHSRGIWQGPVSSFQEAHRIAWALCPESQKEIDFVHVDLVNNELQRIKSESPGE